MRKRAFTTFITIVLLCVMSMVFENSVFNGHFHKISDGKFLYFHTHPHHNGGQGDPFANHKHTEFEFFVFDILSHLFEQITVSLFIWIIVLLFSWLNFSPTFKAIKNRITFNKLIRAPPHDHVRFNYAFFKP